MNQEDEAPKDLSLKIYSACVQNDLKKIKKICKEHTAAIFEKKFHKDLSFVHGYPCTFLYNSNHFNALVKLIEYGFDIRAPLNIKEQQKFRVQWHCFSQLFRVFAQKNKFFEREKSKKILILLLEKKVDVSCSESYILEPSSPLYEYIKANHHRIKKNDPILSLFIKNGGNIEGDTRYYKYELPVRLLNNLFHNIIHACKPSTKKAVSIAKTVCFAQSHNVRNRLRAFACCLKYWQKKERGYCVKLPKPLFNKIASHMIVDDPDVREIIGALDQRVYLNEDKERKPLDYFSSFYDYNPSTNLYRVDTNPYPVYDKQEIIIYDPQEWMRNPLKQLISCNQSKK